MQKAEPNRDFILFAFIIVCILGYFFVASFTKWGAVNPTMVNGMTPVLVGVMTGLIGYKWGSSQSSKSKDAAINEMLSGTGTGATENAVDKQINVNIDSKKEPDLSIGTSILPEKKG